MRLFLAYDLPEEVKGEIAGSRRGLERDLPPARWTRPKGQHATVQFLGEASAEQAKDLAADLGPALASLPAARLHIRGGGFFPNRRRPRVAWVGGEHRGCREVAEGVHRVTGAHGFPSDGRLWSFHLTQARLRRPWPADAVERFSAWADALVFDPVIFTEVVLFASELRPSGAVYTALERFSLA